VNIKLRYREPLGVSVEAKAIELNDPEPGLRPPLEARRLRLELIDSSCDVRCVRPANGGPGGLTAGYQQLDNEILAGVRLARLCAGGAYPPELSRLIGYEADSAEPFALLEPLRGTQVADFAGTMMTEQRRRFQVSLLRAVRYLNAAGIAHRGISPYTVRWDGHRHVQLTDFSQATLIGVPRSVAGTPPWQAPEQRSGQVSGEVGPADDMWAVGRLIFHVVTGDELDDIAKLHELPDLAELLDGIIGPPERRPAAQRLLQRLSAADAPPRSLGADPDFERGRAEFFVQRRRKHPQTAKATAKATTTATATEAGTATATGGAAKKPGRAEVVTEPAERRADAVGGGLWLWAAVAALVVVALFLVLGR
jgi:hypothetical protein